MPAGDGRVSLLREVAVPPLDAAELEPIIGPEPYTRLLAEATMFR